jgi:hypothetical protein
LSNLDPALGFVRVERDDEGGVIVLAGDVQWSGPADPRLVWMVFSELPENASEAEIDNEVEALLDSDAHFATCDECGERNPLGWMLDGHVCQCCAERNHGVVY